VVLEDAHRPPADALRPALRVDVPRGCELLLERAAQARLLVHFPQRALLVRLALVRFPLRKRPVVVLRTVYEEHVAVAADDAAGRPDDTAHVARASFFHDARQLLRASARRARSRSMSRPATSADSGVVDARSRSTVSATTESWCSPSTSCNVLARFTTASLSASSYAYRTRFPRLRSSCSSSSGASSAVSPACLRSFFSSRFARSLRVASSPLGASASICSAKSSRRSRYRLLTSAFSSDERADFRRRSSVRRSGRDAARSSASSSAVSARKRSRRTSRSRAAPSFSPSQRSSSESPATSFV